MRISCNGYDLKQKIGSAGYLSFGNKIALTGLLSSLLDIPAGEITSLEFPDTFLHGEYAEDREGILDVKVHPNHCFSILCYHRNRTITFLYEAASL